MRLAQFIAADMAGILQEWEEFARSLPCARSMDPKELRDHAGKILKTIASDMECPQNADEELSQSQGHSDAAEEAGDSAAQQHGGGRLEDGFSMPEMVAEFRALRASVLRRWREQDAPAEDAIDQVTRFNEGIDQALSESVKRFWDRLNRTRELFMGALGHDLRSPLQVILSAAAYLQKPETPARKHSDMVDHVRDSAQQIHTMIEELLDVAHTKLGGQLPINPRPVDAAEVCNRVIGELRTIYSDREFRFDSAGDVKGVWDGGRLQQLMSNLLKNAVQHGAADQPILVSLQGDRETLAINVHNDGEAIPKRIIDRIFEPLVRADSSEPGTNARGNMGLGLYIACSVARAHHGSIDVQSSDAAGTTFKVLLPKNGSGRSNG
ncbi:ATP-binding protein [Peristeroidobacter agariperforans]|uniref:ATP-binding protein n=1 Tax=Peristeroidobacter agariperforans TaxID=268404 RepID=UPI00101D5573|nr:sensor histidine kinase [Peristeroidobacter agariperforans]